MTETPQNTGSRIIRIEKLVPGGDGLGHLDGGAVFVPGTAPGDLVSLRDISERRGVHFAEYDQIIERSPCRRDPPCPWFGDCGGCQWMHMDYADQVRGKEDILRQTLGRIGHLDEPTLIEIHSSPDEFHYRYRARLQINGSKIGFYRRRSRKIVSWDRCMLLPEALNEAVRVLKGWFREHRAPAVLKSFEIALSPVDGNMTIAWIFSRSKGAGSAARKIMGGVAKIVFPGAGVLAGQVAQIERGKVIADSGGNMSLDSAGTRVLVSAGTFFQVNPWINAILVNRVLKHLQAAKVSYLLDLYCGNGNFSLPAAAAGMSTVGVESSPGAVRDAQGAARPQSRFVEEDVVQFLAGDCGEPDAVIVDPPRTGLPAKASMILGADRFPCLIYVSCEPATLARDLARLIQSGYSASDVELFDMFPQTSHSEVLVVLKG